MLRSRTESIVFFEQKIDVRRTDAFIREFRLRTSLRLTLLHLLVWAAARTIQERPRLNRFTAGGRIYQRRGIWITFSAKTEKTDEGSLKTVKRLIDPEWSLDELVKRLEAGIGESRSNKPTSTDKELSVLLRLPAFLLAPLTRLVMFLDRLGLLPASFIRNDPMFSSVFVTNIGSIGMEAPFHHLFEYGNTPIFLMAGRSQDEVVAVNGRAEVRPMMTIRYSFDERIEDGLYCARALDLLKRIIENPETIEPTSLPQSKENSR